MGRIVYTVSVDEYVEGATWHTRVRGWILGLLIVLAVLFAALSAMIIVRDGLTKGSPLVLVLPTILIWLAWRVGWAPTQRARRLYKQTAGAGEEVTLEYGGQGLHFSTARGAHRMKRDEIHAWRESSGLLLMHLNDAHWIMVPKRAFASAEALDSFRRLLPAEKFRR
jgi:hypothetical protein